MAEKTKIRKHTKRTPNSESRIRSVLGLTLYFHDSSKGCEGTPWVLQGDKVTINGEFTVK